MKNKFLPFSIYIFTILSLFISCNNQNMQPLDSDYIELSGTPSSIENITEKPIPSKITNKRIIVLFGYDFNSTDIVQDFTARLSKTFGVDADGGLIYPVVYPSDFKHNTRDYANDLTNLLQSNDREVAGVVILGAPERTHLALAKNQDKWNQKVPYPVIALFPQDESLGLESTCDIVLDKGQSDSAQVFAENGTEEIESQTIKEAPEILINTIKYLQNIHGPLEKDSNLQLHARQMFNNFKISHYVDTETGLPSVNHFVLN